MLWVRVLNVIVLLLIFAFILYLVIVKGCSSLPPRPLTAEEQAKIDNTTVLGAINAMNVMTNILIAAPAIALMSMGFIADGTVTLLCAAFSILWHASGWTVFGILDEIFAVLAFIIVTLAFLRIVQVRGLPEISGFYMILPVFALASYAGSGALIPKGSTTETRFVIDRMVHGMWHVSIGAMFFLVIAELQRTPALFPNTALRDTIRARDERMRDRMTRFERGRRAPAWSLAFGLFRDLIVKPGKQK